ncbi:UNVERIFIED_CONTAM: Trihelix transcription factor A [Sesamum radiatum]|uniref:Trihelix transcription factor A n=1 Tax=Sesamum radiatum TaxID=300843 RepID=A0AAW2VKB8_SESRA
MAPGPNGTHQNAASATNVVSGQQTATDDRSKTPRHPRWTRQETMVLIEGKKIVEEKGRMGRRSTVFGSNQPEPKWDAVSSYCRRHGVSRGPVQCRKRWSNLVSDFKKKSMGFSVDENTGDGIDAVEVEDDDEMAEDEEAGDGLFSEFEQVGQEEVGKSPQKEKVPKDGQTDSIPSPVPISEMKYQPFHQADPDQGKKRQEGPHYRGASEFQEGLKRRRQSSNDHHNVDVEDLLIKAIERNTNLLNAQLEDQKLKCQLDREQQKEQHNSIITSLSKITDALEKIANKL